MYRFIRDELLTHIPEGDITVIGYSLGASLGELIALDIAQYDRTVSVKLFEPLRIGNKKFKHVYNTRIHDTLYTTYGNDTVTKLPPRIFDFHHVGTELHYGPPIQWWKWKHTDHPLENLQPYMNSLD